MKEKTNKAREFCQKVKELAKEYDLSFFVVTEGASAISNKGCEAVKNARDNHIKWELEHGSDPYEDWSKEKIKEEFISNLDKIHTTELGEERIKKNISINNNVVEFLKEKIIDDKSIVYKEGKNYYCEVENLRITINSNNYCIITAHKKD